MDMTVSPDLEAFCCYGAVFFLGLIAAWSQVTQRLGNLPGQWIMINTWLLFFAYGLVPVGLFWFLDRTNAIHDTSLFAAILVAVGYRQILSGGAGTIRAPGEISKLWQPFAAWADGISGRIRDRIAINDSRFDERLLSAIRSDSQKFDALKRVALVHATDPNDLNQKLQAIDAQLGIFEADGVLAKKAELLYWNLRTSNVKTFGYLLYKYQVIPRKWYFWYAQEWRSKTAALAVASVLTAAALFGFHTAGKPEHRAVYYIWRLRKDSATDYDRFRAREKLRLYLRKDEYRQLGKDVYQQLAFALRTPNIQGKTADIILGLMLETRDSAAAKDVDLRQLLLESLRTENADIRMDVYRELVYLGAERGMDPKAMQDWQPGPKDTPSRIDEMIKKWKEMKP